MTRNERLEQNGDFNKGDKMESFSEAFDTLKQLLNELIEAAKKLRDTSRQVFSEEELSPLQARQEQLLEQVAQIDKLIKTHYPSKMSESQYQEIHGFLQEFQGLNKEFIENMHQSHGLIQFEFMQLDPSETEENEDLPFPLDKSVLLSNPSKTVQINKKKEK